MNAISTPTEHTEMPTQKRIKKVYLFLSQNWEAFFIALLAGFLRLYRIDAAAFLNDEAIVFRMARDLFAYGLFPITSNRSSLGNLNPPLVIYANMIPASLTADPLWGNILVGFCCTLAVLLTYFLTRRYYGRSAAVIASLLFATSIWAIVYSRTIWPQNFLPLCAITFLLIVFRGVLDRRPGWFAPAIILVGLAYQFHGTGIFLGAPLALACVFAFKTLRWRDLLFALLGLLVIFAPYFYWESQIQFQDFLTVFQPTSNAAQKYETIFDLQAITLYQTLLSPYITGVVTRDDILPLDPGSVWMTTPLHYMRPLLEVLRIIIFVIILCAIIVACVRVARSTKSTSTTARHPLLRWLANFSASPQRQGLALLLAWQIIPLIYLLRHTRLEPHYFIIYFPGQFILIAIFLTWFIGIIQNYRPPAAHFTRIATFALAGIIVVTQLIGSIGTLSDETQGHFNANETHPNFFDSQSIQTALNRADKLAQENNIGHIYISASYALRTSMPYLAEQIQTPTTVFEMNQCFILPNPAAGGAIFLSQPDPSFDALILNQYTHSQLLEESPRLAGPPFRIYKIQAKEVPETEITESNSFADGLQLLSPTLETVNQQYLVSRWRFTDTQQAAPRTLYNYDVSVQAPERRAVKTSCQATSIRAGDQLLTVISQAKMGGVPESVTIRGGWSMIRPQILRLGPLNLTTFNLEEVHHKRLKTQQGEMAVTLPARQE